MLLRNLWLPVALASPMLARAPAPPDHAGSQPLPQADGDATVENKRGATISGRPIGDMPVWERTYALEPRGADHRF